MTVLAIAAAVALMAVSGSYWMVAGAAVTAGVFLGLCFEQRVLAEFTLAVTLWTVLIACGLYFARLLGFPDWFGAGRWAVFTRTPASALQLLSLLFVFLVSGLAGGGVGRAWRGR